MRALEPLFAFPGVFVPGNNDYYAPQPKNPVRYFGTTAIGRRTASPLPWPQLAAAMAHAGWTRPHPRPHGRSTAGGQRVALAGTDDPHLRRARYDLIAGPAASRTRWCASASSTPPSRALLARVRRATATTWCWPGTRTAARCGCRSGRRIVTNCGIDRTRARWLHRWDEHMWFHVCAGLGTSPYTPDPLLLPARGDAADARPAGLTVRLGPASCPRFAGL